MTSNIHISRDGQILGVFQPEQILAGVIDGTFDDWDWVWYEGLVEWQRVSHYVESIENEASEREAWDDFIAAFDQDISDLQDAGAVGIIRRITAAEKSAILEKARSLRPEIFTVQQIIFRHFQNLLNDWGRDEMAEAQREADKRTGFLLSAVEIMPAKEEGERLATKKQADFLRDLGLTDETLLASLGIKQASAVIAETLRLRGR